MPSASAWVKRLVVAVIGIRRRVQQRVLGRQHIPHPIKRVRPGIPALVRHLRLVVGAVVPIVLVEQQGVLDLIDPPTRVIAVDRRPPVRVRDRRRRQAVGVAPLVHFTFIFAPLTGTILL